MKNYFVEVVDHDTAVVIQRMGPLHSMREAERLDHGININLNYEHFFTRIVSENQSDGAVDPVLANSGDPSTREK